MNKILLITFISVSFFSCKSEIEKRDEIILNKSKEHINHELNNSIGKDLKSIDSISIISVDTLTMKDEYDLTFQSLNPLANYLSEMLNIQMDNAKKKTELAKLGSELYGGTLTEMEIKSAKEASDKAKTYLDSLQNLVKEGIRLQDLTKKADSIKPTNFKALIKISVTKSNGIYDVDTAQLFFNKNLQLIDFKTIKSNYTKY
ncbi:hypothetical protein OBK29_04185 [Empedobacter falsenii]|uniref:hypothetical protein n=1 Tax=Empedobacter falsenii TaxID=343874 RepID=UPI003A80D8BD